MVLGYRSPGRKRANSPVIPHKATNRAQAALLSCFRGYVRRNSACQQRTVKTLRKARVGRFELHSWLCAEKRIRRLNLPRRQVLPLRKG
jgi:hypothetical protein